jgi:hypothetical protein
VRKKKANQATRTTKEHKSISSQVLKTRVELWTLIWSKALICVLECCVLLLYWMRSSECLGALKSGGWGSLLSKGAPDSPVRQPRHPTVRVWPLELLTCGPPDRSCSLSGAPSGTCSDFCARSCTVHCRLLQTTVGAVSRCSTGTPDSPVNYSGVASQIPEGGKFGVDLPGAPDTVRWHTGQSGAPDQGSLRLSFALFIWTLS